MPEYPGLEPMTRFELVTSSLPRKRSTPELHRHSWAGDEVRTRDIQLGRLTLYQLSYSRLIQFNTFVGRAGFEPAKVWTNRFTVCPRWPLEYLPNNFEPMEGFEPPTSWLQISCSGQLSYIGNYWYSWKKELSRQISDCKCTKLFFIEKIFVHFFEFNSRSTEFGIRFIPLPWELWKLSLFVLLLI